MAAAGGADSGRNSNSWSINISSSSNNEGGGGSSSSGNRNGWSIGRSSSDGSSSNGGSWKSHFGWFCLEPLDILLASMDDILWAEADAEEAIKEAHIFPVRFPFAIFDVLLKVS